MRVLALETVSSVVEYTILSAPRQMLAADVAAFEAVAGDLLEELGYGLGGPRPGAGLRARAALVRARARRNDRSDDEA